MTAPRVYGDRLRALALLEHGPRAEGGMVPEFRATGLSRREAQDLLWKSLMGLQRKGLAQHEHRFWSITPLGREALAEARAREETA
jgi:hypothetical protein